MSLLNDASLILVPSAIKTGEVLVQKPLPNKFADETGNYDGNDPQTNANLTFTRASSATRVGPDGLIEKVRTNLILQSNSFDTTWVNSNTTETGGQAGYDGTNNAWLLSIASGTVAQRITQTISSTGIVTYSVFLKAGTLNWAFLLCAGSPEPSAYFDLQNGVVGNTSNTLNTSITSVGNGWYRCSMSFSSTISDVRIHLATGNLNITQSSGNIYIQDAQLETGDIATDYIATTSAAVSVGPVSGLPRLDYLGSSCGKLLLEPQRTNVCLWSEQIDNAGWTKNATTISQNNAVSPSGYSNADLVLATATFANHYIQQSISVTSGNSYTTSFFIKPAGVTSCAIRMGVGSLWTGGQGPTVEFDLTALTGSVVDGSGVTYRIEEYGNGWVRCSVTGTCVSSGSTALTFYLDGYGAFTGDGTSGLQIWGASLEAGAYATSYVNTLNSAVTRLAEVCSKTGISSLIGQTEGTIFFEWSKDVLNFGSDYSYFQVGDYPNYVGIYIQASNCVCQVVNSGVAEATITKSSVSIGTHRAAVAYANNDIAFYFDGVQVGIDSSVTIPSTSAIRLNANNGIAEKISQALLFKTRLSNAKLAELTTL